MSQEETIKEVLGTAKKLEKEYDWVKAIDVYEQALRVVGINDFFKKAEIQDKIGH